MVVVAILGVLGLVVATNVFPCLIDTGQTVARTNIETMKNAVQNYRMKQPIRSGHGMGRISLTIRRRWEDFDASNFSEACSKASMIHPKFGPSRGVTATTFRE